MAALTIDHLAVPATTETDLRVLQVGDKTAKINFLIFNNGEKNAVAGEGGMLTGNVLSFKVYESNDRVTWTEISGGSFIDVAPGGSEDLAVITQKRYLKITGKGTGGPGYARIDLQWRGDPYFGQVDIDIFGKSGYGSDGGSAAGVAAFGASPWPN